MQNADLEYWMRRALALAADAAALGEVPVGAILIGSDGVVLGEGFNRREQQHRVLGHAELIALDHFSAQHRTWRLPLGTALFTTVEPCIMCSGALIHSRVDKIFYGCRDPKGAGIGLIRDEITGNRFDHRITEIVGGLLEEECANQMKDFFRDRRKGAGLRLGEDRSLTGGESRKDILAELDR